MTDESGVSPGDRQAILASAVDYIESWLDGDPERMARCLHPDLVKRSLAEHVEAATGSDGCVLDSIGRAEMVAATAEGRGTRYARPYDVAILDAFRDIATVRVLSSPYMDYLHLARCDDRWLLVNVLWQRRPGR